MLTRRHFVITAAALFSAPLAKPAIAASRPSNAQKAAWDAQVTPANYDPATSNPWGLHPRFLPRRVQANDGLAPGDIHVDAVARYLYHIEEGGTAMRYGVAIGRGGLYESGTYTIRRKVEWPGWTPTQDMVARDPGLYKQHENGMEPGPNNPLGSRALYLYRDGRDLGYRLHGTLEPWSIGSDVSSGCIRMFPEDVIDLYQRCPKGTRVLVLRHLGSGDGQAS